MIQQTFTEQVDRFAIADGGPLVELQRRLGLLEAKAAAAPRRAAIFVAVAFDVPLALSAVAGEARGPAAERPFLLDWGIWARFVLAIAVLFVLMERLVNERLKVHLRRFGETPLLAPGAMSEAAEAVSRALRRRTRPRPSSSASFSPVRSPSAARWRNAAMRTLPGWSKGRV